MAAEITQQQPRHERRRHASMRPRRMAAEIPTVARLLPDDPWASMRPRRMAAEIQIDHTNEIGRLGASMRPRRMAAEIQVAGDVVRGDLPLQ